MRGDTRFYYADAVPDIPDEELFAPVVRRAAWPCSTSQRKRHRWDVSAQSVCKSTGLLCWWANGRLPTEELAETENDPSAEAAGRGKGRPRVSWPEILRAVRDWLEPYIMLMRYWRAFSEKPSPPRLKALPGRAFSGRGPYLYTC
jgi:hypothetical protein